MSPLHLLGQDDKNKVHCNFSGHVIPLVPVLAWYAFDTDISIM